jgi:hypothetical protein
MMDKLPHQERLARERRQFICEAAALGLGAVVIALALLATGAILARLLV